MNKIVLLFITTFLFGFNSNQITATIISTNNIEAIINKPIQKGYSGYIIQNNKIIAKAIVKTKNKIKYLPFKKLKNPALANLKVLPQKGDKIIFGLYNFRGLIIAPNQKTYIQIQNKYPNIKWLNSDLFANYFETKPTKEDFQNFCNDFNIGIVDFVLDKEYIVDCNSFESLESLDTKKIDYNKPFFSSYSKFPSNFFSSPPKNWIKYYKSLIKG